MGARLRWASATILTIRASIVSCPTRSACIIKLPVWLSVPPMTLLPASFFAGMDSPVTIDSSTALFPSSMTPSTGILSPGRTRRRSPSCTWESGISSSPVSVTRRAVAGAFAEGFPFQGVLFLGVMLTNDGPKLLEYNVRFGDAILEYLADANEDLLRSPERAADLLINEILESVEQPLILVLDDYHHIGRETVVHRIVDRLLQYSSDLVHVMVTTRDLPPLAMMIAGTSVR